MLLRTYITQRGVACFLETQRVFRSNAGVCAVRESARTRGDPGLGQGPEIDDWNGDLGNRKWMKNICGYPEAEGIKTLAQTQAAGN